MENPDFPTVVLSPKEVKEQVNAIIVKLQSLYNLKRWKTPEEFEKWFMHEKFKLSIQMHKLNEDFTFAVRVEWYEQAKNRVKSR